MTAGRLQRLYEWLPLLPLLLLLGATYWLNQQVRPLPAKDDGKSRHDPDFIVSQLSATTLDPQGAPHFTLFASEMRHYPDDDSTHLEAPLLNSFYPDRPTIRTSAIRGEVSSKGTDVYLRDDVKIVREADANQGERTLTTSYLHVLPDQDLMDTNRAVTISDAHTVVNSVGMIYDNKAQTVKLLAQVRSQHEIVRH